MPIDLGDQVTRPFLVTNAAGTLADADSTPVYAVTLPNLSAGISPAVQHGGLGDYYVVYPTTVAGLHRDSLTFAVGGVTIIIRDSFNVEDSAIPSIVSVAETLNHMRALSVITGAPDLEELRWFCQLATEVIEGDLGCVIAARTITETRSGWIAELPLHKTPVISITTVVENTVTLTGQDYFLDPEGWILCRGTSLAQRRWAYGRANIIVTYVAGYLIPPRVARSVALSTITRMWQASQQASHPAMDDVGAEAALYGTVGNLTSAQKAAYNNLRVFPGA